MSLYQCEQCGCMENTACGCFHSRNNTRLFDWSGIEDRAGKALCSVCGPAKFKNGTATAWGCWHGHFARIFLPKGQFKTNSKGNLEHIETGDTDYRKFQLEAEQQA